MEFRVTLEWYRAETSQGVYLVQVHHDEQHIGTFACASYFAYPAGTRGEGVSLGTVRGADAYEQIVKVCRVHAGLTGSAPAVCGAVSVDADGREVAA